MQHHKKVLQTNVTIFCWSIQKSNRKHHEHDEISKTKFFWWHLATSLGWFKIDKIFNKTIHPLTFRPSSISLTHLETYVINFLHDCSSNRWVRVANRISMPWNDLVEWLEICKPISTFHRTKLSRESIVAMPQKKFCSCVVWFSEMFFH